MLQFDHEKLDVYRASLEFVSYTGDRLKGLDGSYRHARDQLMRSSQSIPLNIAEGNGKRSFGDRRRFFEIARGSAMESAATLDVLLSLGACTEDQVAPGRVLLTRIVSMLSKLAESKEGLVREAQEEYPHDGENVDEN